MADGSLVEFDHCRELALLPGSVFEFTSRFLPTDKLEPLLALYALRQAVGSISHGGADDSVKWAKLKWWSEEILAEPDESLRHPVLRALWLSGVRSSVSNSLLLQLVADAISQIDAAPDSDENAMFDRLAALGATEIQLELVLDDAEIDPQSLNYMAAASCAFGFISSFSGGNRSQTERLPLSMLAKYNVSATQLGQASHTEELTQIITQLAKHTLERFSKGMSTLNITPGSQAAAHLQLRWAMERRRLDVISKDARGFLEKGKQFGPSDAWFAWRFLRNLG